MTWLIVCTVPVRALLVFGTYAWGLEKTVKLTENKNKIDPEEELTRSVDKKKNSLYIYLKSLDSDFSKTYTKHENFFFAKTKHENFTCHSLFFWFGDISMCNLQNGQDFHQIWSKHWKRGKHKILTLIINRYVRENQ